MSNFLSSVSKTFGEIYLIEFNDMQKMEQINYWREHIEDFVKFYYLLNDEESKNIFINVFKLYMGYSFSHSKLEQYALYNDECWREFENKAKHTINDAVTNDYLLDRIETYILKGYEYKSICKANKGDYVIDCGAYTGNTSIYFSKLVGQEGRVFSFEAMPQTYANLCNNISNNCNIIAFNKAICDKEKILKFTNYSSPGSRVCESNTDCTIEVKGISIDEFINKNKIKKVDFIKMDIEGSELKALEGCIETCKKFKPKLAVCIYHKADDWINIPKKILEINKNYKFYMKHNSNNLYETVLFAIDSDTENSYDKIIINKNELNKIIKTWKKYDKIFLLNKIILYIAYNGILSTIKKTIKLSYEKLKKLFKSWVKGQ